jgi:hypothetical protein
MQRPRVEMPQVSGKTLVGTGGIEPPTPSASRKCSPAELRACLFRSFNGKIKQVER